MKGEGLHGGCIGVMEKKMQLGLDVLVVECTWNTSVRMVWHGCCREVVYNSILYANLFHLLGIVLAWMLSQPYALGIITLMVQGPK